ncbi:hypothetical protein FQZ97_791430 [compost metagenome]
MLLVSRSHGNNVVTWLNESFIHQGISTGRTVGDDHVVLALLRVQSRHVVAQAIRTFDGAIGHLQRQQLIEDAVFFSGHFQKLFNGQRLDASFGQVVFALVFIGVHPDFNAEFFDLHLGTFCFDRLFVGAD